MDLFRFQDKQPNVTVGLNPITGPWCWLSDTWPFGKLNLCTHPFWRTVLNSKLLRWMFWCYAITYYFYFIVKLIINIIYRKLCSNIWEVSYSKVSYNCGQLEKQLLWKVMLIVFGKKIFFTLHLLHFLYWCNTIRNTKISNEKSTTFSLLVKVCDV